MAAGAGTGRMPWAHFMVPDPTLRGDETVFSMPAISTRTKAPMMSAMESMAPTSWKWTSSGVVPWTFASASVILEVVDRHLRSGYPATAPLADGDFQPVLLSRGMVMVMIMVMIMVMRMFHAVAVAGGMAVTGKEDDALHGFEKGFPVQSEVEQRSEKHVAGDAGEAVKIQGLHQIPPVFASGRGGPFFPILSSPGPKKGGRMCYPYPESS